MDAHSYAGLISVDPKVCHGKPCIKGTRILVSSILSQLAGGYGFEQIRAGYPELTDEHIRAAIEYAAVMNADRRRRLRQSLISGCVENADEDLEVCREWESVDEEMARVDEASRISLGLSPL